MVVRRRDRTSGRARTVAALSLSAAVLAACNILTGLDADYQLKSGASTSEGGTDEGGGTDGQGPDGQTDAPIGQDGGDGGPVSFCASQRDGSIDDDFFCADFEDGVEGNGVPKGWTRAADTFDGGTIKLVADAGKNGSYALDVVSDTAAVSRQTRLYKAFLPTKPTDQYAEYEVEFDFRLLESSFDYDAFGLLVFEPQVKAREHGLAGYSSSGQHKLARQAVVGNTSPTLTVTNDAAWHHASIRLTRSDGGTLFTRLINVEMVDVDEVATDHATEPSTTTELWLGVFNTSTNSARAHILFDNVVFRRRP